MSLSKKTYSKYIHVRQKEILLSFSYGRVFIDKNIRKLCEEYETYISYIGGIRIWTLNVFYLK